jgi:hypothetical protein
MYRHLDYMMGHVPPTYSPKYNEVARVYSIQDKEIMEGTGLQQVAAQAAKSVAPWERVLHAMYCEERLAQCVLARVVFL